MSSSLILITANLASDTAHKKIMPTSNNITKICLKISDRIRYMKIEMSRAHEAR